MKLCESCERMKLASAAGGQAGFVLCPACFAASEQPTPVANESVPIADLVLADINARVALGLERYGTKLQANNGRDALMDAYQEAIDLVMYLRQAIAERDGR